MRSFASIVIVAALTIAYCLPVNGVLLRGNSMMPENEEVQRRYLVTLKDGATLSDIPEAASTAGDSHPGRAHVLHLNAKALDALRKHENVQVVEEDKRAWAAQGKKNTPRKPTTTTRTPTTRASDSSSNVPETTPPPSFAIGTEGEATKTNSWSLDRIDQSAGFDGRYDSHGLTGAGVYVYIVDTGVNGAHAEFSETSVEKGKSFADDYDGKFTLLARKVFPGTIYYDGANVDCAGHGTHVASSVAGKTYGVAKSVRIVPIRVLDCDGYGWIADIIKGIRFAMAHFAALPLPRRGVINISIAGEFSATLNQAVADATAAGMVVVVAAGNDDDDACKYSPASSEQSITVGAVNKDDSTYVESNYGSCVELFAPGVGIIGALNTNDVGSQTMSGTSMASPHVSGIAALLLEKKMEPSRIKAEILRLAVPSTKTSDADCQGYPYPDLIAQIPSATLPYPLSQQSEGQDFLIWRPEMGNSGGDSFCFDFSVLPEKPTALSSSGIRIAFASQVLALGPSYQNAQMRRKIKNPACKPVFVESFSANIQERLQTGFHASKRLFNKALPFDVLSQTSTNFRVEARYDIATKVQTIQIRSGDEVLVDFSDSATTSVHHFALTTTSRISATFTNIRPCAA